MTQTIVTVHGEIHGNLWQPSFHGYKSVNRSVEVTRGPRADRLRFGTSYQSDTVRNAILAILDDGDFQSATFTPDTLVEVVRGSRRRVINLGPEFVSECEGHPDDYYIPPPSTRRQPEHQEDQS